jgi:hypothetical protein
LEEWRDPLWVIRILFPAFRLFCCLFLSASVAHASIRHTVFGLNPGLTYDVYAGGELILSEATPTPSGDLTFTAPVSDPVRIAPNQALHLAEAACGEATGFAVSFPNPNPTTGSFALRIRIDRREQLRIRVIEASAGRQRFEERFALPPGEHLVRLAVPRHLASGLYLLCVEGGPTAIFRKLVILRDSGR